MKIKEIAIKTATSVKTHSPEILIVSGVIGVVTATVLACRATLKVNDVLEEAKEAIDVIHKEEAKKTEKYTEKDAKKDLTIVYVQSGLKFAKLYAPAIILGGLSLTSIFASNNILRKRNMALAAAYTTVDKAYKEYRKRVIEKYGEEVDKQLRFGSHTEKIEEEEVDPETGKVKKVKKSVEVTSIDGYSPYAIYFDDLTSNYFEKNEMYNSMFFKSIQNYLNDLLRIKGMITLNDALDALGIKWDNEEFKRLRQAGLVVGWKYEKDNNIGDNRVLLDIIPTNRKLEDGSIIPTYIIDFNVDGSIYDRV